MINRRHLLGGGLTLASAAVLAGCGGTAPTPGAGGGEAAEAAALTMCWWGNPTRNQNTTDAIAAYIKANPTVTITPEAGEFTSYWDKLATQTAANTMPDVIQHEVGYIADYAERGALLDLEKNGLDLSAFAPGTADAGRVDGVAYGVSAGLNTPVMLADPAVFEQAGVSLPDDTSWTWEDAVEAAAEVSTKAGDGIRGMTTFFGSDAYFGAFIRQNGKELFTEQGLGFAAEDLAPWFELMLTAVRSGALPSPAEIGEEAGKSLDQSALVLGKAAISPYWSNQVQAVNSASKKTMTMLRFPSRSGKATERQAWYKAAMLWSVSARSEHPEASVALVNWWVNSTECADICLAERGIPASTTTRAAINDKLSADQQAVAAFIADIEPELGTNPVVVPVGGSSLPTVLGRYSTDVLFGRAQPAAAAQALVDEMTAELRA